MKLFVIAKTLFKSLFKKPATRAYPYKPRDYAHATRGSIHIQIDQCIFCGICQRSCPTYAIKVERNEKKWMIDRLRCVCCNACVERCPKKCLIMTNKYTLPTAGEKEEVYYHA